MSDPERIPEWLKSLPLAPEYHPTETEFADPIAFISRIEREASAFGICKIVPPFPKPSKKFVLSNLTCSLAPTPSSSSPTRFTTRHQELGDRRVPTHRHRQQVWQSGEFYTLEQFESKSKSFQKSQVSGFKEITPLLVESLFWKAASAKPIYIEYANDVPGSGFAAPEEPFLYRKRRRKLVEQVRSSVEEGTAGWKLSNSPWNLQVIARAPGSLTRFMPDEVPGVTSPMVYIGMLFSWFAWHVEDHELHSLNFLHMGAPKTWYAVAGEHASRLEEIVRVDGYGGDLDRLEAFTMLGEKTTLLSPGVIVKSGVPCCRLVQNPGDFVVTFPRAYHVGFSHGFNCGEAANFATPQWLKVAKEAAVRRAAMNHLPMLSHQQLLYMLTVSFISRVPRALLSGVRSSRLSDRKREEREILVKKAFLNDMMNENNLLCALIQKGSTSYAVLWEPDLLPSQCIVAKSLNSSLSLGVQGSAVIDDEGRDITPWKHKDSHSSNDNENPSSELIANPTSISCHNPVEKDKDASHADGISSMELLEILDAEEDALPIGLNIDSGTLPCVACGILGYPFMAIVQPAEAVTEELFPVIGEESHVKLGKSGGSQIPSCLPNTAYKFGPEGNCNILHEQENPNSSGKVSPVQFDRVSFLQGMGACDPKLLNDNGKEISSQLDQFNPKGLRGSMNTKTNPAREIVLSNAIVPGTKPFSEAHSLHGVPVKTSSNEKTKWNSSHGFNRPRIFCLQHTLEVEELLHNVGGAHVLVICHSDYLKIKAYMPSIAEEVGLGINITDVPLENASPSDMNLINTSIDDGEHEQHGEDWTSKLGVNLQYSMKLRKQSTSKQEWLTLALGRIFSNPVSLSDFSTLKWHSRRSRTPSKVVGVSAAKSHFGAKMEKSKVVERNLNANFTSKVKDYQSCRRNPNDTASKHHGFKNVQNECGSGNGSSIVNVKDDYSTASCSHNLSERVEDDRAKGLFTVPVSSTEDLQMQQGSWFPLKVGRANEVTNFDFCESHHACVLIPVLECSDTRQGTNSPVQFLAKCRVNDSKNQEPQPHQLEPEVVNSEVPDEIETLDEINSEHEAYNNVESGIDPTSQGAVTYTGDIKDIPVLQEYLSRVSGLGNYLLSADQSHVPALSNDSAEKLEVAISDDSNLVNVSHSLKPVGQLVSNQSTVDSLLVQQKEIPVVKVSVEASREDTVDHSSKSDEQVVSNPSTIDKCRIQQKEVAQLGVPIGGEPKMEGRINPSLRPRKHFVNHPSSADRRGMQQELSTAEDGENGNDDHSSRSERLLVSNLSMLDATSGMQQEIPAAENNLQRVSNVQVVTQQNAPIVVSSEVQQEISANGTNSDNNVNSLKPVVDSSSVNSEHVIAASAAESSEVQESVKNKENFVESCNKNQNTVCIIQYMRRRTKRKREEQMTEGHHKRIGSFICSAREEKHIAKDYTSYNSSFIRGPCEGLRPRAGRGMGAPVKVDFKTMERNRTVLKVKSSGKDKLGVSYECEVQGCRLKFRRKQVLNRHMQNRCTYRGCGKQFRSHKDLMRHLRVHDDERPLKCPWKGCRMSFKWEWARTEHFRIHTGERPYQCTVSGCELTFRYVSDFSRHRRKTGHYVNATDH